MEDAEYDYRNLNVETQTRTSGSFLNWMTSLIRLRQECVEIGLGEWKILQTNTPQALVITYEYDQSCLCILHNFDSIAHQVEVRFKEPLMHKLINLMAMNESVADEKGNHTIRLEAYGYRWYRASGMKHFVERK